MIVSHFEKLSSSQYPLADFKSIDIDQPKSMIYQNLRYNSNNSVLHNSTLKVHDYFVFFIDLFKCQDCNIVVIKINLGGISGPGHK